MQNACLKKKLISYWSNGQDKRPLCLEGNSQVDKIGEIESKEQR